MQLLQSWKESLAIFSPKNFKVFFLVTLKAVIETLNALVRYCWAPLILFFLGTMFDGAHFFTWIGVWVGPQGMTLLGYSFLIFLVFLAARPSVLRKGYWYFASYWYYWVYVILFRLLQLLIALIFAYFLGGSFVFAHLFVIWLIVFLYVPDLFVAFFLLFLLDSDGSPREAFYSVWRALKMFVYNVPTALLIWFFGLSVGFVIAWIPIALVQAIVSLIATFVRFSSAAFVSNVNNIMAGVQAIGLLLSMVVVAAFMTNLYTKRLHDQCGLYFETKEKE